VRVVDDTTDFGNGLMLRTTCEGVEFKLWRDPPGSWPGREWTPGISREELARFLDADLRP
jgi:hypothetical protein